MYARLRDFEVNFISHMGYNISYLMKGFYFYQEDIYLVLDNAMMIDSARGKRGS